MSALTAVTLGSVPAAFMLLFTLLGLNIQVSPSIAGALQHFAAGVLLCTIGTELLPTMVGATGWDENLAAAVGFFAGVAVLIVLGIVLPEADLEVGDEHEVSVSYKQQKQEKQPRESVLGRRCSIKTAAFNASLQTSASLIGTGGLDATEESGLLRESNNTSVKKPYPAALILAVAIDSLMDGLLIGIAVAAGPSAGPMMSASLTVEMSFLGLTLATALYGHSKATAIPSAMLGPLSLVAGAAIGGLLAFQLGHNPVLLVGMLSFGTSALLFMVAEELLLEAHEDEGEHLWWVDLQLYTGFFASVVAGKFVPS